ncbi:MAG: adenylosuccinate synthase [Candidatus Aminicenantes bacterium]|nr:adenylosuccinate synthase [Candidatus Aminicenantes bacterium]
MMNLVVIGAQWGDEGKGKVIDILSGKFHLVVRYQGGENAGHTVISSGRKVVLHTIPSGILKGIPSLIGNGVVIHPPTLIDEIASLESIGINVKDNLKISRSAHLVLPIHREAERISEEMRGGKKIGTTRKGIGPAYEDKYGRRGIRVGDLEREDVLKEKIEVLLEEKYRGFPVRKEELFEWLLKYREPVLSLVVDSVSYINSMVKEGKNILFEGAQGTLLDIDFGTYPYVTSSNSSAAGVSNGAGISPRFIDGILGIAKLYSTRVGAGPFPTELKGNVGKFIREKGGEFGATTGRPRRCGWLDLFALKYSVTLNGFTGVALMKLDVLDNLDEIKVAVAYRYRGKNMGSFIPDPYILEEVEPVYRTFKGWQTNTRGTRSFDELPQRAKDYIKFIKDYLETEIWLVSTGPSSEETIILKDI